MINFCVWICGRSWSILGSGGTLQSLWSSSIFFFFNLAPLCLYLCERQACMWCAICPLGSAVVQISDRHFFVTKVIKIPPKAAAWRASVGVGNLAHVCHCVGEYVSLPPNLYSSPHLLPPRLFFHSSVKTSQCGVTGCCLTVRRARTGQMYVHKLAYLVWWKCCFRRCKALSNSVYYLSLIF